MARGAGWRLQLIIRPRRFFSRRQIFNLYKCQVLSYIESGTPGYYHASRSVLSSLDRVQQRLLRELGVSAEEALRNYRLAPLQSRRDIAMLGMLHRIVLGDAPQQLVDIFPFSHRISAFNTRVQRHDRQFVEHAFRTDRLQRSAFGLTVVYNLLPPQVVACMTVSAFQSRLQMALRNAADQGVDDWFALLTPGRRIVRAVRFQS